MADRCPDCGAGFKPKPFNRNGWYYAECGRRFHREHGWEPMEPRGCLDRQLAQAKARIKELEAENKRLREAAEAAKEGGG